MTTQKQEFSAIDAAPAVLYAKTDTDSKWAFPITQAMFNPSFSIPAYDRIQVTYPTADTELYTFSLSASTVCVIGVTYSSGALVDVIKIS